MQNNLNRWENDKPQERTNQISQGSKQRKTITVNKSLLIGAIIAFLGICGGIVGYANISRSAEGTWIRSEDDSFLQGMVVEIEKENGTLQGKIIAMGDTTIPFHVGQVKWSELKKVGIGRYTCYDLTYDHGSGTFYYGTAPTEIFIAAGGKGMTLINDKNDTATGQYQTWQKTDNE